MENSIPELFFNIIILITFVNLFSFLLLKFPFIGLIFSFIIVIISPVFSVSYHWNWFGWAKIYSVLISILFTLFTINIYGNKQFKVFEEIKKNLSEQFFKNIFAFIVLINMLEAGIAGLGYNNNQLNGLFLFIISFCVPYDKWKFKNSIIGFTDKLFVLASILSLSYLFIFYYPLKKDAVTISALSVLAASLIGPIVKNDSHFWMIFRGLTLYFFLLQYMFFPEISFQYMNIERFDFKTDLLLKNTYFEYSFLFVNFCVTSILLIKSISGKDRVVYHYMFEIIRGFFCTKK